VDRLTVRGFDEELARRVRAVARAADAVDAGLRS
jgi:hypothetical protein